MADDTKSEFGNPMCMDSDLRKTRTYLAVDVPTCVEQTLQVDADAAQWVAVGQALRRDPFRYSARAADVELRTADRCAYTTVLDR